MATVAERAIQLTVERMLSYSQRQPEQQAAKRTEIRAGYLAAIQAMEDPTQFDAAYQGFVQQFSEAEWRNETMLALRRVRKEGGVNG